MNADEKQLRGAATAPLMYWLLLVAGLSALTVQRIDVLPKVLPLWMGAVTGTFLGQFLASKRVRLWLALFVIAITMWVGSIVTAPFWLTFWDAHSVWGAVELTVLSFAPAAVCGYFSLSERAGLVAFWFPSVPWMLAILDDNGATGIDGAWGWFLLASLGAMLVGFFYARETRRIALWKGYDLGPQATFHRKTVLWEAPLRPAAPALWMAGLGAAMLALTSGIAPLLWHQDKAPSRAGSAPAAKETAGGTAGGGPWACCPQPAPVQVERERVREYFEVLKAKDVHAAPTAPVSCVPCEDGVPIGSGTGAQASSGSSTSSGGSVQGSGVTTAPVPPQGAVGGGVAAIPPTVQAPPVKVPGMATAKPKPSAFTAAPKPPTKPPERPALAHAPVPPQAFAGSNVKPPPAAPKPKQAPVEGGSPLPWLLAGAVVAVAIHLGMRPLRRSVTIRHLRRPLWQEALDQRVSNLWELALVGLRDGGFRPAPGEQPMELARRVGIEALGTCAAVLERARHGVRVDAGDLEAMEKAALDVYAAARHRAGWAARAAGSFRWPLT